MLLKTDAVAVVARPDISLRDASRARRAIKDDGSLIAGLAGEATIFST
jgi:hypothetical protein